MPKWDMEAVQNAFERFSPSADPADPKQRKRLKLVAAATELFIKQGYRKTSVEEVARRAGVANGTLYLYFKTKGELLLHAIIEEKKRYVPKMMQVLSDTPPPERLRFWLRSMFVIGFEMPLASRLMGGDHELMAALDDLPAGVMAQSQAIGVDFIGEMLDLAAAPHRWSEHELQDRASVLYGFIYFSTLLSDTKVRGNLELDRYAAILADMIVDGVKPRGDSS